MGKISRIRQWVIAALCLAAVTLNIGLTETGRQVITTYCDFHTELKMGPAGDAVLPLDGGVADMFGTGHPTTPPERSHRACAAAFTFGLFARPNIPRNLAVWAGITFPFLLLSTAAYLVFGLRRLFAILILAPGLISTLMIGGDISPESWGRGGLIVQMLPGLFLMAIGALLWGASVGRGKGILMTIAGGFLTLLVYGIALTVIVAHHMHTVGFSADPKAWFVLPLLFSLGPVLLVYGIRMIRDSKLT